MAHVAALYRYPVKGFTPEPRTRLTIQANGRVAGDRVLAIRFANATRAEQRDGYPYWNKRHGLALMTFPSLARLKLRLEAHRLTIRDGKAVVAEAGLDHDGRRYIAKQVTTWIRATNDAPLLDQPGVEPLTLIGDGHTAQFQDQPRGLVSLHSDASTNDIDTLVPGAGDARRYRSNIVISGTLPWQELQWHHRVRIGEVDFDVVKPIVRCLATHANPSTGSRDVKVMPALVTKLGLDKPTVGILLMSRNEAGRIRVGDSVRPT